MTEATRALVLGLIAVAAANAAMGGYLVAYEPGTALNLRTVYSSRIYSTSSSGQVGRSSYLVVSATS